MSSMNLSNGQRMPGVPAQHQGMMNQHSNMSGLIPPAGGMSNQQQEIGKPNVLMANTSLLKPLPVNNLTMHNNTSNTIRTSSPLLNQNNFSHVNSMQMNNSLQSTNPLISRSGMVPSPQNYGNPSYQNRVVTSTDKVSNIVNNVPLMNTSLSAPLVPNSMNGSHFTSTPNSFLPPHPNPVQSVSGKLPTSINGQSQQFQNPVNASVSSYPGKVSAPSYVSFPNQTKSNSLHSNNMPPTQPMQQNKMYPPQPVHNNMYSPHPVQQNTIPNMQIRPVQQPPLVQSSQLNQVTPNQLNTPRTFNQSGMPVGQPPVPVPMMNHSQNLPPSSSYPNNGQQSNQLRPNMNSLSQQMGNLSVVQQGYNTLWGQETVDLMQCRNILPPEKVQPPVIKLQHHFNDAVNCNPDIFRCTMTKIPETNNLLQKSRLPLGVLIHPFRDLNHLPVIQCSTIVRCRACRTYINPFVYFVDSKKWKCNLCYRVNELPEEFQYDPVSKSYGDPSRRPEVKSATIEFIAPSEYMLRPPQPAVYLFLFDTSRLAVESGYLNIVCKEISAHLDELPGDARTQVGVICFNSQVHFYNMAEGLTRPHEITVIDINDMFLPCPENLLVNLSEQKTLFKELLSQIPSRFVNSMDNGSALGAALQAAYKLIFSTGGRVTVFQTCLPNIGPGSLTSREDPNDRSSAQVSHLGPATDFYKRLALDCSGQQIAVDLFLLNSQYSDLATLSGISRFSGGCMYHLPLFRADKIQQTDQLSKIFVRYLTRKIGFEAVMRVRCTRGMSIHTFHGNFFVRSTDLLSLPNVNPDAGFGMQLSIDESLQDAQTICLQAALLYTSSKGERRIRVHTLCLPVCSNLSEIMFSADAQCIVGLLAKMAVDRSLQFSLTDARDAFINVCVDTLGAFRATQNLPNGYQSHSLCVPEGLKLLPLYIHALMKHVAFRVGTSTRLDDRIFAMCEMKSLPLDQLIKQIYPNFYPLHYLNDVDSYNLENEVPTLPRLQLTAEKLDSNGVFLLDCGPVMYIYIGSNCSPNFLRNAFGVPSIMEIQDIAHELPVISTKQNEAVHAYIKMLNEEKPYGAVLNIIRDNGPYKNMFTEKLVDDRMENSLSYYEFLQHLKGSIK